MKSEQCTIVHATIVLLYAYCASAYAHNQVEL